MLDRDAAMTDAIRPRRHNVARTKRKTTLGGNDALSRPALALSHLIARTSLGARRHGGVVQRECEERSVQLQDAIFNHRSVRQYAEEEIDEATISADPGGRPGSERQ